MSGGRLFNIYCYRDLRAKLELSLDRLLEVCSNVDSRLVEDEVKTEGETPPDTEFLVRSPMVTAMVRKDLAVSIRDLIHHGLGQGRGGVRLVPFSACMSGRQRTGTGILHAWDVVIKFYEMKGGAEFNSAPARRLSRSFGLDLAGSSSSNKQVGPLQSVHWSSALCSHCFCPPSLFPEAGKLIFVLIKRI